jgi:two-component system, response regulator PdtaR
MLRESRPAVGPPATNEKVVPMQPSASKRPVVLVVEDETLVRMDANETIEAADFDVIEAVNADQAIAILEQRSDIRLIFTDIQMPGSMDGLKLAHFVKGRWPPIKIIATSGQAKIAESDLPEGSRFLAKPYAAAAITSAIQQLIRP